MVQPGDTLTEIAQENSTTWQRIYDKNPSISNPDLIYPNETLVIPVANESLAPRPLPATSQPNTSQPVNITAASPVTVPNAEPAESVPASTAEAESAPPQPVVSAPAVPAGSVWDRLANCESSGNWAADTGNGFYGGLQFTLSSWNAVGGTGLPSDASRTEQIMRAQKLQAIQGWAAWPVCSAKIGLG